MGQLLNWQRLVICQSYSLGAPDRADTKDLSKENIMGMAPKEELSIDVNCL
jgi:hypothetical protein